MSQRKFLEHRNLHVLNIWKLKKLEMHVGAKEIYVYFKYIHKMFSIMIMKLLVGGCLVMFLVYS